MCGWSGGTSQSPSKRSRHTCARSRGLRRIQRGLKKHVDGYRQGRQNLFTGLRSCYRQVGRGLERAKGRRDSKGWLYLVTAWARDPALFGPGIGELQQLSESRRPGLVQGGAEGHLHSLEMRL